MPTSAPRRTIRLRTEVEMHASLQKLDSMIQGLVYNEDVHDEQVDACLKEVEQLLEAILTRLDRGGVRQ